MASPTVDGLFSFDPEDAGQVQDTLNSLRPFPNLRLAQGTSNRDRQVITWTLPDNSTVQMYINPQSLTINERKAITPIRTKGGFVIQYWGEELTEIILEGTTGSSGYKGIEVLRDIYRAEQRAFELVGLQQTSQILGDLNEQAGAANNSGVGLASALGSASERIRQRDFILRPSLGGLATNVKLFYQGIQWTGFFTAFSVRESTQNLGLFDYTMNFTATRRRGQRQNFMAWHKEPIANDFAGALLNGIGNSIRRAVGFTEQAPTQFHPENAPLTFGGNSVTGILNFTSNENQIENRTLIP